MGSIWKVILGIFVCVMIISSGFGVLSANNEAAFAESYLHAVCNVLSASGFSEQVKQAQIAEANSRGYQLEVVYVADNTANYRPVTYAIVSLTYPYDVEALRLHVKHKKQMVVY